MVVESGVGGVGRQPEGFTVHGVGSAGEVLFLALVYWCFCKSRVLRVRVDKAGSERAGERGKRREIHTDGNAIAKDGVSDDILGKLMLISFWFCSVKGWLTLISEV